MSKNILEKILKLSHSEKEYLNNNFDRISSILDIKIAIDGDPIVDQPLVNQPQIQSPQQPVSPVGPQTPTLAPTKDPKLQAVENISNSVFKNYNKDEIISLINKYNLEKDEDILEEVLDIIYSIPGVEDELNKADSTVYELADDIFENILSKASSSPEAPSEVASEFEKMKGESEKSASFIKSFEDNFGSLEGIDRTPISEISKLIEETLAKDFYKQDSNSATLKIITGLNSILKQKYDDYQDELLSIKKMPFKDHDSEKTLKYYRNLEKNFPEFLLKMEIERKENKDMSSIDLESYEFDNDFYKTWLGSIRENNELYQEQVDAALEQREFFEIQGRSSGAENYTKAARFCRKCKQFWGTTAAPLGGINQSEEVRSSLCRMDKETGEQLEKEKCDIVKSMLSKKVDPLGGIPEFLGADVPLSVNLGKDFFGISTGELEFLSSGDEEKRERLLVTDGHMNNINSTIVGFLTKAKELEASSGVSVFGSVSGNQKEYVENLTDFVTDIKDFIETFHYFYPSFFSPQSSNIRKKLYEDPASGEKLKPGRKSINVLKVDEDRYAYTLKNDMAIGRLSEVFGKIKALELGMSPDSVGSFEDGTLNVDVTALSDLWNMVSYFPNLSLLGRGSKESKKTMHLREHEETLPYVEENVEVRDSKNALAHPDVLARSSTELKVLNEFVEKIVLKLTNDAIKSGELEPLVSLKGAHKKPKEELDRLQAINEKRKEKIEIFRIKAIQETLKAKEVRLDVNDRVAKEGNEEFISKDKELIYLPGLNLINDSDLISVIDSIIEEFKLNSENIFKDPDNLNYYCSPKVIAEKYKYLIKAVEELGYEDTSTRSIMESKEEKSDIFEKTDVFGEKVKIANSEVKEFVRREGNLYPEYVEIINKILTLPKELVSHLTQSLNVVPVSQEVPVMDNDGFPIFYTEENGMEEQVFPNYDSKQFEKSDGTSVNSSLVNHKKKKTEDTLSITGTALANPKARQVISLICLGYSMRDKANANPSKIYSIMHNATEGGVLPHSAEGGAAIFSENRNMATDMSQHSTPMFVDFLMKAGARIGNTPVSSFYDKTQYMGIFNPGTTKGDKPKNIKSSISAWYRISKIIEEKKNKKKYNYVIVTTKYDARLIGRDLINNTIAKEKTNIPFMTIVPFSNFGSLEKVIDFATDIDNPYMAVAISEDVESVLKQAGFWPIKDKGVEQNA